jgi:DnaJ-class molecular chaperone
VTKPITQKNIMNAERHGDIPACISVSVAERMAIKKPSKDWIWVTCPTCKGEERKGRSPCPLCRGKNRRKIKVPPLDDKDSTK